MWGRTITALLVAGTLAGCGGDPQQARDVPEPARPLCPKLGERGDHRQYMARAEMALLEKPIDTAERIATASGCHVAAAIVDGEPQPLTREYDPSRISVEVRDGVVRRVIGFG